MREIKFRLWHYRKGWSDRNGKPLEPDFVSGFWINANGEIAIPEGGWDIQGTEYKNQYVLMQFTGLYDGLGKEIYEKDIIEYEGVNSEIVFHQGMFGYMKPHKNGKTKGFNKLGIIGSLEGGKSTKLYRVRVVGNRFDNPSLIKE